MVLLVAEEADLCALALYKFGVVGIVVDDLVGARVVILAAAYRYIVVREEVDPVFAVWRLPL